MKDLWASEDFENQVAASTIAMYETDVDPHCNVHSINRFSVERLAQMRKHGIYIPAPDREILMPGAGMSILKWPTSGCISLGGQYKEEGDGQVDDLIESYCRLIYFRRLNRLPSHSSMTAIGDSYEMLSAWPQNKGAVIGLTDVINAGDVNKRIFALCDRGVVSRVGSGRDTRYQLVQGETLDQMEARSNARAAAVTHLGRGRGRKDGAPTFRDHLLKLIEGTPGITCAAITAALTAAGVPIAKNEPSAALHVLARQGRVGTSARSPTAATTCR